MWWKKLFLLACLNLIVASGFCQSAFITGTVSDSKTNESLPLATVFINNTTISTASQVDGQFRLKNIPAGPAEVVVSYIGYESSRTTLVIHDGDRLLLNIKLIPSAIELPDIRVTAERDKDWEKHYQRFEKIFLGENSTRARIINPGVIDFEEVDKGVLSASASETIEIENPALGYRIFYYLRKFQSDKKSFLITGDMRFEELKDSDEKRIAQWTMNRKDMYSGSLRHLLVSLINNRVEAEGFKLYIDKPGFNPNERTAYFSQNKGVVPFNAVEAVFPGTKEGEFIIQFTKRIEVHYKNKIARIRTYRDIDYSVGWIDPTNGFVEVNSRGIVVNRVDLVTSGYLSDARVASLLPSDYTP